VGESKVTGSCTSFCSLHGWYHRWMWNARA